MKSVESEIQEREIKDFIPYLRLLGNPLASHLKSNIDVLNGGFGGRFDSGTFFRCRIDGPCRRLKTKVRKIFDITCDTPQSGLGTGHYRHPNGARVRLSGSRARLVQPQGPGLATVHDAGIRAVHQGFERRHVRPRQTRNHDRAGNLPRKGSTLFKRTEPPLYLTNPW